jgi:predicted DNA binding protein
MLRVSIPLGITDSAISQRIRKIRKIIREAMEYDEE